MARIAIAKFRNPIRLENLLNGYDEKRPPKAVGGRFDL